MDKQVRKIDRQDARYVATNFFDEKHEREVDRLLEQGYWVFFIANCIGHTRAAMLEEQFERYIEGKYGDVVQAATDECGLHVYYRLK